MLFARRFNPALALARAIIAITLLLSPLLLPAQPSGAGTILVAPGTSWSYFKGTTAPPVGWETAAFDDASWPTGPSGFGYGDGDDATVLGDMQAAYLSVYVRTRFGVDDPTAVRSLILSVDYDDGFVAYMNGREIARANVGGHPPLYTTPANGDHEASAGNTNPQPIGQFDVSSFIPLLVKGQNTLALEGHNVSLASSDLSLIPSLSATMGPAPAPAVTPTPTPPPAQVLPLPVLPGATWRYLKGVTAPPADWAAPGFNDSGWPSGPSGFGYGDGDDATALGDMYGKYRAVYIRTQFAVDDPAAIKGLTLSVDYDDGFVAYLNGKEAARANVIGDPPSYSTPASGEHEASGGNTSPQPVEQFDMSASIGLLAKGLNVLALEGHNSNRWSSDFSLIPTLAASSVAPAPAPGPSGSSVLAIMPGDTWRYSKGVQEPPADWNSIGFDDSQWLSGPSGFGFSDNDDATVLSDMPGKYLSVYIRKSLTVADPGVVTRVLLTMDYDDGFIAYVNGIEVARAGMRPGPAHYNSESNWYHEASRGDSDPQPPDVFDISGALRPGLNVLAIEGHNRNIDNGDFSLIPSLTASEIPADEIVLRVRPGDQWRYFRGASEPSYMWTVPSFDDSGWESGPAGFGYGDGDDTTVLWDMEGGYLTLYARHTFTVDNPVDVKELLFSIDYDDGFVAYLNGREIVRNNVTGTPPAFDTAALSEHEGSCGNTDPQVAEQYDISGFAWLLVPGQNVIAVQGHNRRIDSYDFSLIPSLLGARGVSLDPVLVQYPYLQAPSATGVTVVWGTKGYGEPTVRYGTTTLDHEARGSSTFIRRLGGYYRNYVILSGLEPGKQYNYRILLNGAPINAGPGLAFRAPPSPANASFTFGVVGDMGTATDAQLAVRDRMEEGKLDLLLGTGDIDERTGSYQDFQRDVFMVYRDLFKRMPFAPTIGNSEYWSKAPYYNVDGTERGLAFNDMFVLPGNAPGPQQFDYYSFNYGNMHFVALDTENIGLDQVEWLDADLAANRLPWTVVFLHRAPFDTGKDHPITEGGPRGVRSAFVPIFERYHVNLVFAGHNAVYARTQPLIHGRADAPYGDISTVEQGGIVYVTTGGGGDLSLDYLYPDEFHAAPGAYTATYHYTRVAVNDCKLTLEAIDKSDNIKDTYTLDRCGT